MTYDDFLESLQEASPPEALDILGKALWWDAKGDWDKAHGLIDSLPGAEPARIHAYLHRKEGDLWNADYWYRRADTLRPESELAEEWKLLVEKVLS